MSAPLAPAAEARLAPAAEAQLEVRDLTLSYDGIRALHGVSFTVGAGEIVTLVGANGAGKTSVLRAISGLAPFGGSIRFEGQDLRRVPAHRIVGLGIAHVPEGRGVFGNLTVHEIPRLRERLRQPAGTLSGGEQQMLAVGRALMSRARLLLLDEPSMGLSPRLVQEIFRVIEEINRSGVTVLLVEQNANMALHVASRAYVLETGAVTLSGTGPELRGDPRVREAYLGA